MTPMTAAQLLAHHDSGHLWPDELPAQAFGDLPQAYQQALAVRALRVARGEVPRGYKIGFTNRQIWERYRVWAPIWGPVWDSSLAFCEGQGTVSLAHTFQPRIEPELVFGLKSTPVPQADAQALFDAIAWVAPGFEIVQSHRPGWRFTAPETVADGALHARLLVGERVPLQRLAADASALNAMLSVATVQLQRDGADVEAGRGANVLDSPLLALLHFLAELRACPGVPDLQPGDVVTTGTWTDAWPVQPGQTWQARFSDPLPPLSATFV